MSKSKPDSLRVAAKSNPNAVAGALLASVRDRGAVDLEVVGAGALNQAVKAIAIARRLVESSGLDLIFRPAFADRIIDGEERTALRLMIEAA